MNLLVTALAEVGDSVRGVVEPALAGGAFETLGDDDLLAVMGALAAIARRVEGALVEAVGVVEARSQGARSDRLSARAGCRSVSELVQRVTRVSPHAASGMIRAGRVVHRDRALASGEWLEPTLPALRDALVAGEVGVEAVNAIAGPLTDAAARAARDDVLAADAFLADAARGLRDRDVDVDVDVDAGVRGPAPSVADLRAMAHLWASAIDADGAEPVEAGALRGRGLALGVPRRGLVPLSGMLLPEVAAQLQTIFDALMSPRVTGPEHPGSNAGGPTFREDAAPGSSGDGVPVDGRTRLQKQHDAFATALGAAARAGELATIGGAAPTLVVYAREDDLVSGSGWAQVEGSDQPVSTGVAAQIACCGTIQRVGFDGAGRIVSLGVRDRVFTAVQRKAIALRDGGCVIPGCGVRAAWCEVHHDQEHSRGGPTHCDNGLLLCWFHHRTLGTSGWSVRMRHGVPEVRGPAWWDPHRRWRPVRGSPLRRVRRAQGA
ncbi:DUF222 domain-containing protein [Microbacterium sp. HA-8]|uniref:HNH endonuclease signature motif containing protein n=1 Tax=Microbacterium sp. HA-8 TaxID=3234200 RepID=UPI0038F813F9